MTQSAMDVCASENARDADAAMNDLYERLLKRAPNADARKKLQAAQTAWLAFRKAELAAKHPSADPHDAQQKYGTVWPMCATRDYVRLTNMRTEELKELVVTREGNVCGGAYRL